MPETLTPVHPGLLHLHDPPFEDKLPYWLYRVDTPEGEFGVATDGRMLLAVRGEFGLLPSPAGITPSSASVVKLLAVPAIEGSQSNTALHTTADALRSWAGPVTQAADVPCESCGGDGKCECPRCEAQHDCCPCKGTGIGKKYDIRYGLILGCFIDMNRIARLISVVEGNCLLSLRSNSREADSPMIRIDGGGWIAMLMPMDKDAPEVKEAMGKAPVFAGEVATNG